MATVFEVHCAHRDARYAGQAADAAFDLVDRLEQELSRFIGNSDVSRVNALGPGESTRVSPTTLECLTIARHLFDLTGGAFDVSIGTGLPELDLDPEAFAVRARRASVRLDLGGIGKGYAIDRVAELLGEWGIGRALVHGGFSSVLALDGPAGQDGWPLTLSAPGGGGVLARVSARGVALSASGTRKKDHIVDPRTGRPATRLAAWVALPAPPGGRGSPSAVAEGLSTAFMLMDESEIEALVREGPGVEAWLLAGPSGSEGASPRLVHLAGHAGGGLPGAED
ncbi:MAG TPA: FAD:protein FMN transferase [Vicinamibacteria bacterium]